MTDSTRFKNNGNGTITDLKMKLIWKETDSFQDNQKWQNWFKCQDYTTITNIQRFAGSEEWRYPNEEEAWSLFDLKSKNTDKYGDEIYLDPIFKSGSGGTTWTIVEKDSSALVIQFEDGVKVWPSKYANMNMCVRLVRTLT
ncbi:MAG TPA: DUF1566 domain-containing protein [Nitrospinaceae bacterium]|jgi:hypothetical protein|nr:hypothetical protein [Nitrospinota bacterium]MDP6336254.1 DUF1566 domain-containing protein [Nitrospinaceae bacterium]HAX45258.1 hypothetical protein [Nitrospina sp.]MBV52381.1 hypothetical protein [Nitrospinota bacterium]MDP7148754.1 DUF1566 domain-containing protein [Nitrospinaceae bacterium]|tara:strand:+ start:2889 stop:3311 length:423 start_codon:yes stop_codon:yes gene_type:complete